jgi:thiamine-phosphate pyrophosphorylase
MSEAASRPSGQYPSGAMTLPEPPILLITDRRQARLPLDEVIAAAVAGGCRWVSLREKDLAAAEQHALLERLVALGRDKGARVMLHGDAGAIFPEGVAGLHLPAGGDVAAARARLGAGALIGVSCHAFLEIVRAAQMGADYVTLSPIFASPSKPAYGPALGPEALAMAAREKTIPILALGGVTPDKLPLCFEAGAAGAAIMGGVMSAPDPEAAMAALVGAWKKAGAKRTTKERAE